LLSIVAFSSPPQYFSVLLDKSVAAQIALFSWCPTMDLLALVGADNRLLIHRLSWQQLHSLSLDSLLSSTPLVKTTIEDGEDEQVGDDEDEDDNSGGTSTDAADTKKPARCIVTSLCWRPDGKQLVVGLRNGHVLFLDVETGALLPATQTTSFCAFGQYHSLLKVHSLYSPVSALRWVAVPPTSVPALTYQPLDSAPSLSDSSPASSSSISTTFFSSFSSPNEQASSRFFEELPALPRISTPASALAIATMMRPPPLSAVAYTAIPATPDTAQHPFSLLLTGDQRGNINGLAFGRYRLFSLSPFRFLTSPSLSSASLPSALIQALSNSTSASSSTPLVPLFSIDDINLSPDLSRLLVLVRCAFARSPVPNSTQPVSPSSSSSSAPQLKPSQREVALSSPSLVFGLNYDTSLVRTFAPEFRELSEHLLQLTALTNRLQDLYNYCKTRWDEARLPPLRKVRIYLLRKATNFSALFTLEFLLVSVRIPVENYSRRRARG